MLQNFPGIGPNLVQGDSYQGPLQPWGPIEGWPKL